MSTAKYNKKYFTSAFQALCTKTRCSYLVEYIYLKFIKRCEMPTCKLTRKTYSHILLHVFCLYFLRTHHDYFFRRVFESVRAQCGLAGYLQFTFSITIPLSQLVPYLICNWTFPWVQFLSNKLKHIRLLQCKDYENILLFALCLICTFFL